MSKNVTKISFVILVAALVLRFIAEVVWLLPSPVADNGFFITASANYCRSGFLGTTAYPIDPTGQARMVWHGFVSIMLLGRASPTCSAVSYYLVLWLIKAATLGLVLVLARLRKYSLAAVLGLGLFVLAAQTASGFRPEALAIFWIMLAEIALIGNAHWLYGALSGALLCTQPTVAGLYGLCVVVLRPQLMKCWLPIGAAVIVTVALLLALYPFPVMDLIAGIRLQAVRLVGRSDGSALAYYILNIAMPGWGVLLVAALIAAVKRTPWFLLLGPILWFFGPRVPPVFYNLVPVTVLLIAVAFERSSPMMSNAIGCLAIAVALLGLGLDSTHDLLTAWRYGDTFAVTGAQVAVLAREGHTFDPVTPLVDLTNPELRLTDPLAHAAVIGPAVRSRLGLYAVNGMPSSPCAVEQRDKAVVSLTVGDKILFNSNSGWMIYVCDPMDSLGDQTESVPATRGTRLSTHPTERRPG